jgi:quinol-cytochrome oxidoreductase complex cytochrome b subunit
MAGRESAPASVAGQTLGQHQRITALKHLLTHENVLAVVVFLLLLALIIFLHGATPTFIYQGF